MTDAIIELTGGRIAVKARRRRRQDKGSRNNRFYVSRVDFSPVIPVPPKPLAGAGFLTYPPAVTRLSQTRVRFATNQQGSTMPGRRQVIPLDREIGALIGKSRRAQRWKLQALADMVGISGAQLSKYETGASRVSAGMLFRIARALDLPVAGFFPSTDTLADGTQHPLRPH